MKSIFGLLALSISLSGCVGFDRVHVETTAYGNKAETKDATSSTKELKSLKWSGVFVSAIVPVPLMIPYGRETETNWVRDGKVVYTEFEQTKVDGYGCPWFTLFLICGRYYTWGAWFLDQTGPP